MNSSYNEYWLRGAGFLVRVWSVFLTAFAPSAVLAGFANETDADAMPEWLRLVLVLLALGCAIVLGPVAVYWIGDRFGLPIGEKSQAARKS